MAKRAKGAKRRKAPKSGHTATVRVRFANEGHMAKKKSGGKRKGSHGRRNPSRRKGHPARRRRNPATFMGALGHLGGAALVAVASGAAVLAAQSKWAQPNASTGQPNNLALYGIPIAAVALAAALAKKAPTIAAGMATGAIAGPFALPLYSRVMTQATPTPAATAAATHAALGAVQMGWIEPMSAVQLGHAY